MQTEVEELPENRVRLTVQVPSHDVHHAVEHAASDLAETAKIPGFRKGKVPRQVLVQRFGRERLMTEAVESHISGWFWNAAAQTRVRPVEQPEYDFELPASDSEDWKFTATVAVQAKPELADWKKLEVGAYEPEVPAELIDRELEALQSTVAELVPVEGRPVAPDDTVVVDLVAPKGETRRDYVVELGRGAVVEEIEQGVVGMSAGETKEIEFELADGTKQAVTVTVKEIKEKVLPPLDDELARAATEFETIEELRADIESRLLAQISEETEAQIPRRRRRRARRRVEGRRERAARRGAHARAAARPRPPGRGARRPARDVPDDDRPVARRAARAAARGGDALGRARARARGGRRPARASTVPDEEIEALVREQADVHDDDVDETLSRLRESGRFETLRDDLRLRDALDRIASEVKRIPRELAAARESIWTPDKEKPPVETKLWTPGSGGAT